ncbi:polysaccharide deacetylase family protein [Micromonospora pisi]|uniref:polysaccharide deacetylase family protein n=1 Tax=Micromonospora pisi TaxID=589240 RepID=UPI001FEC93C6|nr:polysaccharide deacetylase family protein [Micromonospora pisi]
MPSTPTRRILSVLPLLALLTLSASGAGAHPTFSAAPTTTGQPSPSDPPPVSASATPSGTLPVAGSPAPKSLAWYLAQVPDFPEAPPPQRVQLPKDGSAPFWFRVPTDQKVAFITIDDGGLARPPAVVDFIREAHIPVTMFLNSPAAAEHTPYFKQIEAAGGVVENHTITHTSLKGRPYAFQKHEICGAADKLEQLFGKRPTLFRPPFGNRDATTLKAAYDCGMKAVFHWTETVNEGIVRYQTPTKVVKPGEVLLMHFRPALMDDLLAALKAIHRSGLTPVLLEDYVG